MDLISREELLKHGMLVEDSQGCQFMAVPEDVIVSADSADVRPNIHARWESDGHGHIICTACKGAKLNTHRSKFCDSCGAIMDGEPKADDLSTMFENVDSFSESDKEKKKSWEIGPKREKGTGCTSTHNVLKR